MCLGASKGQNIFRDQAVIGARYLQRIIIPGERHQQLPEGGKGHQCRKFQAVVGGHVLEQHVESVDGQVLPLKLVAAIQ